MRNNHLGIYNLDCRNLIGGENKNAQFRQKIYQTRLKKSSGQYQYFILTRSPISVENEENIFVSFPGMLPKFILSSIHFIKHQNCKTNLIIAGDPWLNFLSALIIKIFIPRIKIQVQFHADLFHMKYIFVSTKNFLKALLGYFSLFIASNVRFVSQRQLINAKKFKRKSDSS